MTENQSPTPCPRPHHLLRGGERCPTCKEVIAPLWALTPVSSVDQVQTVVDSAYALWENKNWTWDQFLFHLSYPQKVGVMFGKLYQQVKNGGLAQFGENEYYTSTTAEGMLLVIAEIRESIPEASDWCTFMEKWMRGVLSLACTELWWHNSDAELDELDGEFYAKFETEEDFFAPIAAFLRMHRE